MKNIQYSILECQICPRDMTEVRRGILRNTIWRCRRHKTVKIGILTGSFFENSNLKFTQMVGLLHHFSKETSLTKCALSLELDKATICHWYKVNYSTPFHVSSCNTVQAQALSYALWPRTGLEAFGQHFFQSPLLSGVNFWVQI